MTTKSEIGYRSNTVASTLKRIIERNRYMKEQAEQQAPQVPITPMLQGPPNYPTSRHYSEYDQPGPPGGDPTEQIYRQLQQLMNPSQGLRFNPINLPEFDPNQYKGQAEAAVNAQFSPVIQDILRQQGAARTRAAGNKQEVAGMYAGLANSINADTTATNRSYDAAQAESKKLYSDERNRIAAGYAADAAAQRAAAKRLGIQNLGQGVEQEIAQQQGDQRFAEQLGSQQMQSTQGALGMQQSAAGDYDRAIANASRAEGAEVQQDITRGLEDYLSQSNTNLSQVRSQQAGSINDLMMQLANAAYQRDTANQQFQYQQQRDYIGDQNSLFDRQMKMQQLVAELAGGQGQQGEQKLNPWQQTASFAEQLQPGQGSDIVAALQGAMNERPEIWGRNEGNSAGVEMNPALFAKLVADSQSAEGIDRNVLMQVAQELYRLLYGMG